MDNSDPRMPQVFEVSIAGEDIFPESIRASDLAEILKSIEKSVTSVAVQMKPELDPDEFIVGLVQIEKGSAKLAYASTQPSIAKDSFEEVSTVAAQKNTLMIIPIAVIADLGANKRIIQIV